MPLSQDLLAQAKHLARLDANKPKQANLRRAVSSAYYALFHLLVHEASHAVTPRNAPAGLSDRIQRAFAHEEMKQVCKSIKAKSLSLPISTLLPDGFSAEITSVAVAFHDLQDARHIADYDVAQPHSKTDVLALIQKVEDAFEAWSRAKVKSPVEASVFLTALLLSKKWAR
ncbi:MAG: hypothetical protein ACYCSN_03280 [Acidobacteriaceae bacterium]